MNNQHEATLSQNISTYLQKQYKHMIYRYDIADLKLTMPQAVRLKKLQGGKKGFPDLFICEMRGGFGGLYIELKKDIGEVYKKNGEFKAGAHIQEQNKMHELLREKGYFVVYGFGFSDTVKKINRYMSFPNQQF